MRAIPAAATRRMPKDSSIKLSASSKRASNIRRCTVIETPRQRLKRFTSVARHGGGGWADRCCLDHRDSTPAGFLLRMGNLKDPWTVFSVMALAGNLIFLSELIKTTFKK